MSDWTKFVSEFYKKKHASNPDYKFKDALKEAAKVYKKGTSNVSKTKSKAKKSVKSRKNKTMKKNKSRKH